MRGYLLNAILRSNYYTKMAGMGKGVHRSCLPLPCTMLGSGPAVGRGDETFMTNYEEFKDPFPF
jgi:hypothetical protein